MKLSLYKSQLEEEITCCIRNVVYAKYGIYIPVDTVIKWEFDRAEFKVWIGEKEEEQKIS